MHRGLTSPQEALAKDAPRFQRELYRSFRERLSWEDVEDLVQTELADDALMAPDGRTSAARRAWFRAVLRHAALDELRRRGMTARNGAVARGADVPLPTWESGEMAPDRALICEDSGYEGAEDALDREYDRGIAQGVVRRALRSLSRDDRALILMRTSDGLKLAEIAEEFELSESAIQRRWAKVWLRFIDAVAGVTEATPSCHAMRMLMAGREIAAVPAADVARFEAHMAECAACRVWERVGAGAMAALPVLPTGGLAAGLLSKLGIAGLVERVHATGDHVAATAAGAGGAGAGLLGALGGKVATTCVTAAVCAGGVVVGAPVVERAVAPKRTASPRKAPNEHASTSHSASTAQASTGRTTSALVSPPTTTMTTTTTTVPRSAAKPNATAKRSPARASASAARRRARAQAVQARASGSPFTPEANDPPAVTTPSSQTSPDSGARSDGGVAALKTGSTSSGTAAPTTPGDAADFTNPFSP